MGVETMRVQQDVRVTFRIDKELKERAERLFENLGMNMSTALNVFLRKSVEEAAIPFPVSSKSPLFGAGNMPDEITRVFISAVDNEIAKKEQNEYPVARYDIIRKEAYLQVADGKREYING